MSKKYRFILNYNPKIKCLVYEYSQGSGFDAEYGKVDEKTLENLSQAKIPFSKYDSLLTRRVYDPNTLGRIKTGLHP